MALNDKLTQVNRLKHELDAMQPMSHENDTNLWKKIRLDWDFNSNHIEGNTLTYGETMLLLIFDKTTGDHELREYEEMKAHDVAIHMVKDWAKDKTRDLTESDIRELNKVILVKPYWKEAITQDGQQTRRQIKVGEYKEHPNSVRLKTGEIFQYTSPLETPLKMAELMQWYKNNKETHPLVLASQLHYDFIRIHPFDDGNGRVARLLVNYVLMKNEYPPIIVKAADKDKYLTALNKADTGDINAFHEYMADQLIWSLELAIKAAKGESIEETGDLQKEIYLWKKEVERIPEPVLRTSKIVYNIYDDCLKHLLYVFIEKHKQFSDLFKSTGVNVILNNNNFVNPQMEIGPLMHTWVDAQIEEFFNIKNGVIQNENINEIIVMIHLNAFRRAGLNVFPANGFIAFNFLAATYAIRYYQDELLVKPYPEDLTEEEINEITDECVRRTFESIKTKKEKKD